MTATLAPHVGDGTATEREISQQPEVWRETARIVEASRDALGTFLEPLLALTDLRIVLTGAGTSAFIGEIAAPALARRLGRRVDAVATTDIVSDPLGRLAEDVPTLLVSFARSGDSPESLAATAIADEVLEHVHHLVISCNPDGRLAREHTGRDRSLVLLTPARSNDAGFAMTSSFTAMLLAVLLVLGGDDDAVVESLARAAEQVLTERGAIAALAERRPDRVVYLGSGPLTGLARESALKMLEVTAGRVDTYFDSAMGFRHGPKAVLDERTLVVVYVSSDPYTSRYDEDVARELRSAIGSDAVVAVRAGVAAAVSDLALRGLEGVTDAHLALPFVVAAQLLALHTSVADGLDPDDPVPSGLVNRVVQGVAIHPLRLQG